MADSSSTRILDDVMFMPFRQSRINTDTSPFKIRETYPRVCRIESSVKIKDLQKSTLPNRLFTKEKGKSLRHCLLKAKF